jgi:hypothetical protein
MSLILNILFIKNITLTLILQIIVNVKFIPFFLKYFQVRGILK